LFRVRADILKFGRSEISFLSNFLFNWFFVFFRRLSEKNSQKQTYCFEGVFCDILTITIFWKFPQIGHLFKNVQFEHEWTFSIFSIFEKRKKEKRNQF
jgi:hypothetical protein